MPKLSAAGFMLPVLLLVSCRGGDDASAALGEVPDTVSENYRQVTVSPEGRVEVEAARVETFDKKDITVFHDAAMREKNSDGELTLEGRAGRIEVDGDRNGTAEGDIRIRDITDDSTLEAGYLAWDDGERLLTGEGVVTIDSGDGVLLSGEGFRADMARETFEFTAGVTGTLEVDDDEN